MKITLVKICINLRDIVDISIIFKMEIHSEKSCTNKMHKLTTDEYRNHSKSKDLTRSCVNLDENCSTLAPAVPYINYSLIVSHQRFTVKYPDVWTVTRPSENPLM